MTGKEKEVIGLALTNAQKVISTVLGNEKLYANEEYEEFRRIYLELNDLWIRLAGGFNEDGTTKPAEEWGFKDDE